MEYDVKTSKHVIADLCVSDEFELFKSSLRQFNEGIDESNVENVFESIVSMGKARDMMLSRLNLAFKYKIEKYLTKAQIDEVDMVGNDDGVFLSYKKYVPSYKKDGVYTSVDLTLVKVDFKNSEIYVPDLVKLFEEAEKYSKQDRFDERTKLEVKKYKINEMKINRDSMAYVINTVKEYNKDMIKNNAFERIKCFVNKSVTSEYILMYDEILKELQEDYSIRDKDFKMTKSYSYNDKLVELRDMQEGLIRRLSALNFSMNYENPEQKINVARNPLSILNVYKK